MFVSRDLDHKWIGNFLKKKHLALSHLIGKQETSSLYFSLADFSELIDRLSAVTDISGVKIYFATWCTTGNPDVDNIARAGYMDQLTLLFGATDNLHNDLGQYFIIKPPSWLPVTSRRRYPSSQRSSNTQASLASGKQSLSGTPLSTSTVLTISSRR
jgi:hypothetical protein